MQVSAINSMSRFGNGEIIDVEPLGEEITYPVVRYEQPKFDIDKVDFSAMAEAVNKDKPEDKATSPAKFFITTGLLALASFAATKKVSGVALKTLETKLALDKPLSKLGVTINNTISKMKAKTPVEVTSIKSFFINNANRSLKWLGTTIENAGKNGITAADIDAFSAMMGKDIPEGALYAKNALRKGAATMLGLGTAGATVASRYKDDDANGIPDKAEKTLGKFNEAKEILKNVAAVCDIAA